MVPQSIISLLKGREKFLIIGHEEPDGDCLGSQLALALFLRRLGKEALLYSPGPFKRNEINHLAQFFDTEINPIDLIGNPLVVVVDCSTDDRTGHLTEHISSQEILVIDHHTAGEPFGNHKYIDSQSPSTTILIHRIIKAMGYIPTPEEAEYLFLGICTDTGFFRHVEAGQSEVFKVSSELVEEGADPKATFAMMYAGKSFGNQKLIGRLLSRMEQYYDGQVIFTYEQNNDRYELDVGTRDSDTLYQMIQAIANVEAILLIRQESANRFSVGLRSKKTVDVGELARKFGGGGHMRAAGFAYEGTAKELKKTLLDAFKTPEFKLPTRY